MVEQNSSKGKKRESVNPKRADLLQKVFDLEGQEALDYFLENTGALGTHLKTEIIAAQANPLGMERIGQLREMLKYARGDEREKILDEYDKIVASNSKIARKLRNSQSS